MDKLSEFQHLVSDRGSNVFLKTHDIETRLVELVKLIEISEEEEQKRAEIQQVIEKVLERSFPDVEVHPFGSSACGLGLSHSDLDLHVDFKSDYAISHNRKAKTEALADAVKKHKRFKGALPILDCRTPIVQLWDKRTRIKCDLSVCSSMGVHNTRFVKFCLDFDPRARLLAMVVKCFAKKHHITGSGLGDHLTSYCLVLMVIFFLQVEGVLHTLAALQSVPGLEEVLENDFNFSFCTDSSRLPRLPASKHLGLAELLRKFFRFFADFNFNAASVCLRHGVPAERPVGKFGLHSALVVQDPFEGGRNVAVGVTSERLARMVATFTTAGMLMDFILSKTTLDMGSAFVSLFQPGFPEFPQFAVPPKTPSVQRVFLLPAGSVLYGRGEQ